jgi:hypothetical protein
VLKKDIVIKQGKQYNNIRNVPNILTKEVYLSILEALTKNRG